MYAPLPALLAVLLLSAPASAQSPGDLFAQGYRHLTGQGMPKDATRAAALFLRAAKDGEPQAQFQLGAMHMEGLGVPKDHLWAYFWLDKAVSSPALPEQARREAGKRLEVLKAALTQDEKRRLGLK